MKLSSLLVLMFLFAFDFAQAEVIDVTNKVNQMRCILDDEGEDSLFDLKRYPGTSKLNLYASWQCGLLRDCSNTFAVQAILLDTDRMEYTAKLATKGGYAVISTKKRGGVYNKPTGQFVLAGKVSRRGFNCTIN